MPHPPGPPGLDSEISGLAARREQLRRAAAMPGVQLRQTLDAAVAELDGAIDTLTTMRAELSTRMAGEQSGHSLLAGQETQSAVFLAAPVPLFLLERDGTVLRANRRAGQLLGFPPGYATGKAFTALVDLPARPAVRAHLDAARRTGAARQVRCSLLGAAGPVRETLDISSVGMAGEPARLIVAATPGGSVPAAAGGRSAASQLPSADPDPGHLVMAAARTTAGRLDALGAATRMVLESATVSESAMLQRCARLLASELAAWVIVDSERRRHLRRQFVLGPRDEQSVTLARTLAGVDPQPESVPSQVHRTGSSLLIAHAEDAGLLGTYPDGVPVLTRLGSTSVLSVPLSDGERCYGALTLAQQAGDGYFGLADVGLAEEIGEHLALAIRAGRMLRQHAGTT